jgi:hypothetical protein
MPVGLRSSLVYLPADFDKTQRVAQARVAMRPVQDGAKIVEVKFAAHDDVVAPVEGRCCRNGHVVGDEERQARAIVTDAQEEAFVQPAWAPHGRQNPQHLPFDLDFGAGSVRGDGRQRGGVIGRWNPGRAGGHGQGG